MTSLPLHPHLRELAARDNDGIHIQLMWDPQTTPSRSTSTTPSWASGCAAWWSATRSTPTSIPSLTPILHQRATEPLITFEVESPSTRYRAVAGAASCPQDRAVGRQRVLRRATPRVGEAGEDAAPVEGAHAALDQAVGLRAAR